MISHPLRRNYLLFIFIAIIFMIIFFPIISLADADRIFKENNNAVVVVITYDKNSEPINQGSGFIVRQDGAVVTNYHAISDAIDIKVRAGNKVLNVEGLLHIDKENDIVILKAKGINLQTVKVGDIQKLSVGEKVYVISSPRGLENTISEGILSGIREIDPKRKILQITAPVSEGSSGGPVFNKNGEVVGIATYILEEAQNLNFAMPVNLIKDKISSTKVTAIKDTEIEDYKKTAEYWFYVGVYYVDNSLYNDALDAYKQSISINPNLAEARINLGISYFYLGMYKEAIEAYKQAIRIKPDYAMAHYNLGAAYNKLDMHREAIEAYKQAIRIKPDDARAHLGLGFTHLILNDKSSALEEYKILKELDHEMANELFNLIYK